ncbi:MAG: WxL domain-containing protein [Oscillospiraceae bacterium]|jgi:hypothetical protein|nr:WxL domain-containing protein [Oscillospiraceae bacterium]
MKNTVKNKKNLLMFLSPALVAAVILSGMPVNAASEIDQGQTQASITFTGGELKLNSVPVIDFGTHDISNELKEYAAESVTPVIQVGDLRGNGNGWDLVVTLSPFTLSDAGGPTLQAAAIKIANPVVSAVNGTIGAPPVAVTDVEITSDSTDTPVWKAAGGEGMGVWNLTWKADDTKLVVKPGTARQGTSTATLNWSLQSTP